MDAEDAQWTVLDNNGDGYQYEWGEYLSASFDPETGCASLQGSQTLASDDYLATKPIRMEQGTAHISFYFTGGYSDDLKDEVERREAELEMLKAEEGGGMGENFLSLGREEVVAVNRASSAAPIEDKGRDESQSVFYLPFSALFLLSVFASLAITFILDWLKKDKRNAKRNNR